MAGPDRKLRTRFAPSPTGYLHLGHVAHMLYVWGVAEILGAEVLLRIEDHDRQRSQRRYERELLRDLEWLGFEPVNRLAERSSSYRQSDCHEAFAHALRRLERSYPVYRCVCTRKQLADAADPEAFGEQPYPGTCRNAAHPASQPHGLRLAWEPDAAAEAFTDGLLGRHRQEPREQCGDLLLRDRNGNWSYQFSVTVDDVRHGVDFVVRGEDLLQSTGRQLRLARMLGAVKRPAFYHHPLVRDARGAKLGKRQGSPAVRELRQGGICAARVLGEAASGAGLIPEPRAIPANAAAELIAVRHPGLGRRDDPGRG
ncbi:MAG: glutamate--tRNA ligase family protein [Bryobacterales bacterium]|nr:glutamate--tRNA ligase family protein [Bryobacterales bacterium]MDE0624525.1 glutamate--tRNA ligase family protein [Bryobacterales bacterium]